MKSISASIVIIAGLATILLAGHQGVTSSRETAQLWGGIVTFAGLVGWLWMLAREGKQ